MAEVERAVESGFPVARCALCARDVLTHVRVDEDGRERRCCIQCDAELDPAEVRWVGATELETVGYSLFGDPGEGCGRPGCGQGRCANRR